MTILTTYSQFPPGATHPGSAPWLEGMAKGRALEALTAE
jgi:hypothetical protein